ncbi:MAG TPA: hypothetical protein EYN66_21665, partial [Myxococcales bacterium]|nr:hypothetical protein [Myxococcales bacterium]
MMTFWKQFLGFGLLSVSALAIAACGGSDCGETGGGSTTVSGEAFQAGTFQLYTTEVSDKCLDGGLGLLFQPEGAGTEYMLANTTEFPGIADLPSDLVVQLEAPFSDMAATVEADGANMKIVGAGQENVV